MENSICNKLNAIGFSTDSFFIDEEMFGNIIIKSRLECGEVLSFIKDRGIWDCNIVFRKKEIPLIVAVNFYSGIPFKFEELSFDSDEVLIQWLINQKKIISLLSKEVIKRAEKQWKDITKKRLKNMLP